MPSQWNQNLLNTVPTISAIILFHFRGDSLDILEDLQIEVIDIFRENNKVKFS